MHKHRHQVGCPMSFDISKRILWRFRRGVTPSVVGMIMCISAFLTLPRVLCNGRAEVPPDTTTQLVQ